jgi:hypothetical protein
MMKFGRQLASTAPDCRQRGDVADCSDGVLSNNVSLMPLFIV